MTITIKLTDQEQKTIEKALQKRKHFDRMLRLSDLYHETRVLPDGTIVPFGKTPYKF